MAQTPGNITTIAGNGTGAFAGDGGPATQASLKFPARVALDSEGNLHIADSGNNRVRVMNASGNISTIAGNGASAFAGDNGPATQAGLNPAGVALDDEDNVYVSDGINHRIRKIDASGNISTIAGDGFGQGVNFGGRFAGDNGPASQASLNSPKGMAIRGDSLYIADHANRRIRCINLITGVISTVAGDGGFTPTDGVAATQSGLLDPYDVAVDNAGNLYIALLGEHAIRKVHKATGTITTVAGGDEGFDGDGGPATDALLDHPQGVAVDGRGNIFIGDAFNNRVRMVNGSGIITTIAGSGPTGPGQGSFSGDGGPATQATLNFPSGVRIDDDGHLLIVDGSNHRVRRLLGPFGSAPPPPTPVKVALGTTFGAPGDTVRIPVLMTNPDGPGVGGLQTGLILQNPAGASFVRIEDDDDIPGFDAEAEAFSQAITNLTFYSPDNDTIPTGPNPARLVTLVYVISPNAPLGSTNPIDLAGLIVSDKFGFAMDDSLCPGAIQVGIRGDIDLNGRVNILDVVRLARILVMRDPKPPVGTTPYEIADANNDDVLDVMDILTQINLILNSPPASKPISGPILAFMGEARLSETGLPLLPLYLEGRGIGGFQATLAYDPTRMDMGTPFFEQSGWQIVSHALDGRLRLIAFRMPGAETAGDGTLTLWIPVNGRSAEAGDATLELVEFLAGSLWAQPMEVVVTGRSAALTHSRVGAPTRFALLGSHPNPFNPTTTITYEVAQQTHIRLVVYNLLGQEVIRLVDGVQAAGRYNVVWDGRNSLGRTVASGVYVYRMTTGAGFTDVKRMTLVK